MRETKKRVKTKKSFTCFTSLWFGELMIITVHFIGHHLQMLWIFKLSFRFYYKREIQFFCKFKIHSFSRQNKKLNNTYFFLCLLQLLAVFCFLAGQSAYYVYRTMEPSNNFIHSTYFFPCFIFLQGQGNEDRVEGSQTLNCYLYNQTLFYCSTTAPKFHTYLILYSLNFNTLF